MTEPRYLPRVSDEEFAEELSKVRGEGHILIERLLLDHRDASEALGYAEATNHRQHEEVESLRARLIVAEDHAVVLRSGLTFVEVERDAALRERDQWIDTCEQTGNKMHAEHHRAEAAEARLARLREVVGHQADLMEGIGEHALTIAEDTIGEDVPWGKSPEFRVAMQRLFRSIGNQIATDLRAALAETVSAPEPTALPQEPK